MGSATGGGESGAIEVSELLSRRLGIAGSGDRSIGEAITGGADSGGGKVSALLGVGGAGVRGGSAGRGATSGTGAGSGSGAGSISVRGSGMGDSEGCSWSSGVGDGSGSASGSGAGVSGLGNGEGSALVSGGSICSGMLLLSKGGVGPELSSLGSRGLLSTDGCPNIGPDKSRDLSKSSRDWKDSILGRLLLRLVLL